MDLIDLFVQGYERPATRRAYGTDLRKFSGSTVLTPANIAEVFRPARLDTYMEALALSNSKASTIQRHQAVLRCFVRWAHDELSVDMSQALERLHRRFLPPDFGRNECVAITDRDVQALLAAAKNSHNTAHRDYAVILLILECGLRRSEVSEIDLSHITRRGSSWTASLSGSRGGGHLFVQLSPIVVDAVNAMISAYRITDGPLFRSMSNNSRQNRLSARSVYSIVHEAATRAGLDSRIGADDLRFSGFVKRLKARTSVERLQVHAHQKGAVISILGS